MRLPPDVPGSTESLPPTWALILAGADVVLLAPLVHADFTALIDVAVAILAWFMIIALFLVWARRRKRQGSPFPTFRILVAALTIASATTAASGYPAMLDRAKVRRDTNLLAPWLKTAREGVANVKVSDLPLPEGIGPLGGFVADLTRIDLVAERRAADLERIPLDDFDAVFRLMPTRQSVENQISLCRTEKAIREQAHRDYDTLAAKCSDQVGLSSLRVRDEFCLGIKKNAETHRRYLTSCLNYLEQKITLLSMLVQLPRYDPEVPEAGFDYAQWQEVYNRQVEVLNAAVAEVDDLAAKR